MLPCLSLRARKTKKKAFVSLLVVVVVAFPVVLVMQSVGCGLMD